MNGLHLDQDRGKRINDIRTSSYEIQNKKLKTTMESDDC